MRLSLGDFDFKALYDVAPRTTYFLFWLVALLLNFVLVNIFVAIILDSYAAILQDNPTANDASKFVASESANLCPWLEPFSRWQRALLISTTICPALQWSS